MFWHKWLQIFTNVFCWAVTYSDRNFAGNWFAQSQKSWCAAMTSMTVVCCKWFRDQTCAQNLRKSISSWLCGHHGQSSRAMCWSWLMPSPERTKHPVTAWNPCCRPKAVPTLRAKSFICCKQLAKGSGAVSTCWSKKQALPGDQNEGARCARLIAESWWIWRCTQ